MYAGMSLSANDGEYLSASSFRIIFMLQKVYFFRVCVPPAHHFSSTRFSSNRNTATKKNAQKRFRYRCTQNFSPFGPGYSLCNIHLNFNHFTHRYHSPMCTWELCWGRERNWKLKPLVFFIQIFETTDSGAAKPPNQPTEVRRRIGAVSVFSFANEKGNFIGALVSRFNHPPSGGWLRFNCFQFIWRLLFCEPTTIMKRCMF